VGFQRKHTAKGKLQHGNWDIYLYKHNTRQYLFCFNRRRTCKSTKRSLQTLL